MVSNCNRYAPRIYDTVRADACHDPMPACVYTASVQTDPVPPEDPLPQFFQQCIFKMGAGVFEVSQWMICMEKGKTVL